MKIAGGLMGAASGSLAGVTASHNRGGQYLRNRTIPVNPNTARQQVTRSAFGGLVQAWSNELTDVQRAGWREYAANVPVTDTLGNTITLTGQQWFVANNTPRLQADALTGSALDRIDDAPIIFNTGESVLVLEVFTATAGTPETILLSGLLGGTTGEAGDVLIYIGAPQNPGRQFFKGPYQLAAVSPIAADENNFTTGELDSETDWFSSVLPQVATIGSRYPLRVRIAYDDGRLSQVYEEIVTLAAPAP